MAVTEDVFAAYAQMDRRERYLSEDLPTGKVLSLEQMAEDGVLPDYVGAETAPSAEDCVLARESEREREELTSLLLAALIALEDRDGSSSPRCSMTTSPPGSTPGVRRDPAGRHQAQGPDPAGHEKIF